MSFRQILASIEAKLITRTEDREEELRAVENKVFYDQEMHFVGLNQQ